MKSFLLVVLPISALVLPLGSNPELKPAVAAHIIRTAPNCQNIQLTINPQTSQGAAGHIAIVFRLHNQSGRACSLYGYPGVQLLDRHFLTLPTTVRRGPGNLVGAIPKRLIHVGPHGNAYFALGYSDVQSNNQPCETAHYLMIFPPNDILPVVTYASTSGGAILVCSGIINVSPVTNGPRFQ